MPDITGSGNLTTLAQTVGITGQGNLLEIEQAVVYSETGRGQLLAIGQNVVNAASGNLTTLAQRVAAPGLNVEPRFDLELIIGTQTIANKYIYGQITITFAESSAALMNVTLSPPKGPQNVIQYQGKPIILNYIDKTGTYRIYTGKVDIPEVDLIRKKITLRCTDNRSEQNNALDEAFVSNIGHYSEAVFGEAKDQNEEIENRLSTVQASLDYDAYGQVTYTSWEPKATPDYIISDPNIYRRTPSLEVLSRGRVVNQINIELTYRWQRLRHRERSWSWKYPFDASSWCGYLVDNIGLCPVDAPRRAAEGAGWPIKADSYQTTPLPPSKWYKCTSGNFTNKDIGWQTSKRVCDTVAKENDDGDPVKDSEGNQIYEQVNCKITDGRTASCISAQWTASKRWAQTIEQRVNYTITAPQSVNQYELVERDERTGAVSDYNVQDWEAYDTHTKPPANATQSPNGDWVINKNADGLSDFNTAVDCIRAKAVADILASHRQNYVTLQIPIMPALDLRHTLQTTAGIIQCKGKVSQIRHTLDVANKFSETQVRIALSRVEGAATTSLPSVNLQPVTDTPNTPKTIRLSNWIGGRAPRNVLGFDFGGLEGQINSGNTSEAGLPDTAQGFVTNYKTNRNRPLFTESFVVDTPDIEAAARDLREIESNQTATLAIRNDPLEIVFDE